MGKNSTPQYNPPPPPKYPTADELYGSATNYAKTNTPLAFGARESALSDLSKGNSYYEGFQPTSFEQALGNQYFQNVWPGQEESIKHSLSLSGLDSSPVLASMIGTQRGQTEFNIADYLNQQGNQRANFSLSSRLGIDPNSITSPYVQTGTNQGNMQVNADYDYQQQLAQVAYQQAVEKYNQSKSGLGALGGLGGAALGALLALPTGGMSLGMGALLGGLGGSMASPIFGGSPIPGTGQALGALASNGLGAYSGVNPMTSSSVNPSAYDTMMKAPVNYSMSSSPYNPSQYFQGFGGRGGAV